MASKGLGERVSFSKKEDLAILDFVLKDNRLYFIGGIALWKKAATEGVCPGRGYWSLKERFMKIISKNLQNYGLPLETRQKISNYVKASPAEKKRIRAEYGDTEDFLDVLQSPCKHGDEGNDNIEDNSIQNEEQPRADANDNSIKDNSDKNKEVISTEKSKLQNQNKESSESPSKETRRKSNTDTGKKFVTEKNIQIKQSPKSPKSAKVTEGRRDINKEKAKKIIDFEADRPEKSCEDNVNNPIITYLDTTVFQKILPTAQETRPDEAEKEKRKKSQPSNAEQSKRPKNNFMSNKKFKALPTPERRKLRSALTKLKNL